MPILFRGNDLISNYYDVIEQKVLGTEKELGLLLQSLESNS